MVLPVPIKGLEWGVGLRLPPALPMDYATGMDDGPHSVSSLPVLVFSESRGSFRNETGVNGKAIDPDAVNNKPDNLCHYQRAGGYQSAPDFLGRNIDIYA